MVGHAELYGEIQARGYCSRRMHMDMDMHLYMLMHVTHALCMHADAMWRADKHSVCMMRAHWPALADAGRRRHASYTHVEWITA